MKYRDPKLFPLRPAGDILFDAYCRGLIVHTGEFRNGEPVFTAAPGVEGIALAEIPEHHEGFEP